MATCHTLESTLRLTVIFIHMSALVTPLTGRLRINRDNPAKFVITVGIKASPSSVENDSIQPCFGLHVLARVLSRTLSGLGHSRDLQVFTFQRIGLIGQYPAMLMRRIDSAILLLSLPLGNPSLCPHGSTRSFLLSG